MSRRNYNNPAERVNDLSKYCSLKTTAQWKSFLKKWSIEWLTTKKHFSSDVRKNKWLGYNPATEEQIHSLEKRLGYLLPPSFRTFLLTTNGWRKTSTFIRQIRPISKIEWLEVDDPALLDVWEEFAEEGFNKYSGLSRKEYFSYTDRSAEAFDKSHFKTVLIISEPIQGDSATYLLNPMVVAENGEWEAWFFSNWLPGVHRYPSFAHLIVQEYYSFRLTELNDKEYVYIGGPFKGVYAPNKPRNQAKQIGPGRPRPCRLTIEELIQQLEDPSPKVRKDSAKKLGREFKPHNPKDERPLLIEPLVRILDSNYEPEVRCAAAYMLGSYGNKNAIKPLIDALKDKKAAMCAIPALHELSLYYKSPEINNGVLNYLSEPRDYLSTITAIHILDDYQDPRLIPITLHIIDSNAEELLRTAAALALAHIKNKQAVDELITRLSNKNPEIRIVATAALAETHDKRAIRPLKKALEDENPRVKMLAEVSLRVLETD